MKYQKISLINPPLDDGKIKCIDAGHWHPLNLLTLSSYLMHHGYNGDIQILDHDIHTLKTMTDTLESFKPDLVGFSPNIDNYEQTLCMVEKMKQSGADIVLGGSYASESALNILKNRKNIDYIIAKDGEKALKDLIWGEKEEKIPNLVYRKNEKIIANTIKYTHRANLCEIDYTSFIEIESYFENYKNSLNPGPYKRPVTILSQRGCNWREKTGGCLFCSRIEPFARYDDPDETWLRILKLKRSHGIDAILDVGDDFLGNKEWFRGFHNSRPNELKDMGIRFIYSRVNNIDKEFTRKLRELNTFEICLGLESGDQQILANISKGNTTNQHLQAIKELSINKINVLASFILGLPGETQTSINNTMEHVKRISEFSNITEIIISVMTPLPGSPAFKMLMEKDRTMKEKYRNVDMFDIPELQRDWLNHCSSVSYEKVLEKAHDLDNINGKTFLEFS